MSVDISTSKLLQLATARRDCLLRVRRYGAGQLALIEQGDIGRLLSLLAEKGRDMESLAEVDKQLQAFREVTYAANDWSSEELRSECRQVLAESDDLMAEIVSQDKKCESELQVKKLDISKQLQAMQGSHFANEAYARHAPPATSRLNLSTES